MISLRSLPMLGLWMATAANASFLPILDAKLRCNTPQGYETRFKIITTLLGIFGAEHCSVVSNDDTDTLFRCHFESSDYTATVDYIHTADINVLTVIDSDRPGREVWTYGSKHMVDSGGSSVTNLYHNSQDNEMVFNACLDNMVYLAGVRDRIGYRDDDDDDVEALPPADDPLPCKYPDESPWTVLVKLYDIFGRKWCFDQTPRWLGKETLYCVYIDYGEDYGPGGHQVTATFEHDVLEIGTHELTVREEGLSRNTYETYTTVADMGAGGTYYSSETGSETTEACLNDMKLLKWTYSELRGFTTTSPSESPTASPSDSVYPSSSPSKSPTASPSNSFSPSSSPSDAPSHSVSPSSYPSSTFSPSSSPTDHPTVTSIPSSSPSVDPACLEAIHDDTTKFFLDAFGESNCNEQAESIYCELLFDDGYSIFGHYQFTSDNTPVSLVVISVDPYWQLQVDFSTGVMTEELQYYTYFNYCTFEDQLHYIDQRFQISELRTDSPSVSPAPTISASPSASPSVSARPSSSPSLKTRSPTLPPSHSPSAAPSVSPSEMPSDAPSNTPSDAPSISPSDSPSDSPSGSPSIPPSDSPSVDPSQAPSYAPSLSPSGPPSDSPSGFPSIPPSDSPSVDPSKAPSDIPSAHPSESISISPTIFPSQCLSETRLFCANAHDPFQLGNGELAFCADIAVLTSGRKTKCTSVYKENCPGLCKKNCACHDYEFEFRAKPSAKNPITCEDVAALTEAEKDKKCKFNTVAKNCPSVCDDDCSNMMTPRV